MDLVINGNAITIPTNLFNKVKIMGFDSISVTEEIKTADELAKALKLVHNPFIEAEEDYKEMKQSNFDFLYSLLEEIEGVEIEDYMENRNISFSFKGTHTFMLV